VTKVALVTGGGTGIGAAVTRRLAAGGYAVAVTGRRQGPIEEVARETGGLAVVADTGDAGGAGRGRDGGALRRARRARLQRRDRRGRLVPEPRPGHAGQRAAST
jgi:NAD(P)-dependent dehydrogenase (short-subunit alcohol dehydrogenase family)